MNSSLLRNFFLLCCLVTVATFLQAQAGIQFKLKLMSDHTTWGIFAKPTAGLAPSNQTLTGTGQVTVVMPTSFEWTSLTSLFGTWAHSATVNAPIENPSRKYVTFGFITDIPTIHYTADHETLLFRFRKTTNESCPDSIYLMDVNDPFAQYPNSVNSNPGNDLSVIDLGLGFVNYQYAGNYAPSAWNCHDNDNDDVLNADEDTNGNGVFDPGVDSSDLNNSCPLNLTLGMLANVVVCDTTEAYFVIAYSQPQPELTYTRWQIADSQSGPWEDLTNTAGIYTGINFINGSANGHDTLYLQNVPNSLNGKWYRAEYTFPNCSIPVYSNGAQLVLGGQISVAEQPVDFTNCADKEAIFVSRASSPGQGEVFRQWQMSADGGTTWSKIEQIVSIINGQTINFGGYDTDSLLLAQLTGLDGFQFRNTFWTYGCGQATSNVATLHVEGNIHLTEQPQDVALCAGSQTCFTIAASNAGMGNIEYKWQAFASGSWINLINGSIFSGANTTQLCISDVANTSFNRFRCAIKTNTCDWDYSDLANLTVNGNLAITTQPQDMTQCAGETASFTAEIYNANAQNINYQWQWSTDGINYSDIMAAGANGFSGWNSPSLNIGNITGISGRHFRLKANSIDCPNTVFSQPATLTVEDPLTITSNPTDFTNCADKEAYFFAGVMNPSVGGSDVVQKQWQWSANGGLSWSNITQFTYTVNGHDINFGGYDNDTLLIVPIIGLDGYQFRTKFWTSACAIQTTNAATLHIEGPVTFSLHPVDVETCVGDTIRFNVEVENASGVGVLQYQWQRFTSGGWVNLTNSAPYSGTTTTQLTITPNYPNLYNAKFRCRAKTPNCDWEFSNLAHLFLIGPATITQHPISTVKCVSESAKMVAQAMGSTPNGSTLSYQWQWSPDGTNFTDITSPGTNGFSGIDSTILSIGNLDGLNGYRFRLAASVGQCAEVAYSNPATLNVQNCSNGCLRLKLQLLSDSSGWAVMAKPLGGYVPTANAVTTAGRVTLVAPSNFVLDGFLTPGGSWSPTGLALNVPGHPGRKYFTFDLNATAQGTHIAYDFNEAVTLFQFAKTGACPDSLYLLESAIPNVLPNQLVGQDIFGQLPIDFEYCGVYARKAWRCQGASSPGGPIIFVGADSLAAPQTAAADRDAEFTEGQTLAAGQFFNAQPNPAGDFVTIVISDKLAEGRPLLSLWDLQGKKRQEVSLENTVNQLNLSDLPAGVYLVSLAQNGRVVERKKLVKN